MHGCHHRQVVRGARPGRGLRRGGWPDRWPWRLYEDVRQHADVLSMTKPPPPHSRRWGPSCVQWPWISRARMVAARAAAVAGATTTHHTTTDNTVTTWPATQPYTGHTWPGWRRWSGGWPSSRR